ncbi:hypothetical protein D9M71_349460 [compost metagenome]
MTEDNPAQRPRKETHGEGAESGHGAEQLVVRGEEQRTEHQRGGGGVDVKVVPLDHGANEGSGGRTARLGRSLRLHGSGSFGYFSGRRETANPQRSGGAGLGMIFRSGTMISQFSIYYSKYYLSL